ncbi:zinc metallopeptidase [Luteolibacter sp. Populi]|uniref:zinc metallopeptidase n=1 Tax=Luteolibacter sp. Populi TaxID=3230487 RepID=UPI003466DB1B
MWKLLLLLSIIPLAGAWAARHWFWTRVRIEGLRRDCETSVKDLRVRMGLPAGRRGSETHAAALGNAVRECGLALLEREGDAIAKSRTKGAYLTRALPALVAVVAVFAIFSKRVPGGWAVAGAVGVVAIWTLLRLTGMAVEWRAVARGTELLKASRALKRVDDEQEVIRCAKASVWSTVWPF